ncbi:MAG: 4Fe-4S binding protein [Spirochaetaceae bacterium]|jgi:formate hydrogenlyase subunit 6/NADH:ubiquinone oxidoreductase subunit I|nr:4Fe-4S binding protein [Spirochaetaceae bacterium]
MKQSVPQEGGTRGRPRVNTRQCAGCGACAKVCYRRAISFAEDDKADIIQQRCIGIDSCGHCVDVCAHNAIEAER